MTDMYCEHCLGKFVGVHGLSIHMKKSASCNARRMQRLLEDVDSTSNEVAPHWRINVSDTGYLHDDEIEATPVPMPVEVAGIDRNSSDSAEEEETSQSQIDNDLFLRNPIQQVSGDSERQIIPELADDDEKLTLEVIYALLTCRNGIGLSKEDINRLLKVVTKCTYDPSKVKVKTAEQVEKYISTFQSRVFGEESVLRAEVGSGENPATLTYKDTAKCLKLLIHENYDSPHFMKEYEDFRNEKGDVIYSTPNTGTWWKKCQNELRSSTKKDNADILALIVYSDSTTLSQNGKVNAWPIYMSLGNIPLKRRKQPGSFQLIGLIPDSSDEALDKQVLFTKCLNAVLQPLKEMSETGIFHKGRWLYPILYSYVADHPEGSKVSVTYGSGKCKFPCSTCLVPQSLVNDLEKPIKYRKQNKMKKLYERLQNGETKEKTHSVYTCECPLWGFRFSATDYGNVYRCLLVETMHQADQGVFKRMIQETRKYIRSTPDGSATLKMLDQRMCDLFSIGFLPNFNTPSNVWDNGVALQANEYRSLMQIAPIILRGAIPSTIIKCYIAFWNWYKYAVRYKSHTGETLAKMDRAGKKLVELLLNNMSFKQKRKKGNKKQEVVFRWDIIKVHAIRHYSADIKRSGVTAEFSAELYEFLHQQVAKQPYRTSNKRKCDTDDFLFKMSERKILLGFIEEVISWRYRVPRDTYWTQADTDGSNVLCKSYDSVNTFSVLNSSRIADKHLFKALKRHMVELSDVERPLPTKLNFHTSCAIGRSSHKKGATVTWVAYATDDHHSKDKHCCVAIRAMDDHGKETEWYARIIKFVSFIDTIQGRKTLRSAAYVAYFIAEKHKDAITDCIKLKWESQSKLHFMVEISNILRIVHVAPFYSRTGVESDSFILNDYLFR